MNTQINADPFGAAVTDYYNSVFKWRKKIIIDSSISGQEKISVAYLFRSLNKMPLIEKKALSLCFGKTLDIGACAGSHSLELQKKNLTVDALEISQTCCNIMLKRGVKNVICTDIFKYNKNKYNTILLLMNGVGIAGTINGLRKLLRQLSKLLTQNGQIIFDSSDIDYAYFEEDGSKWVDLNNEYYGQVKYSMQYKNVKGLEFNWLFIDRHTMFKIADEEGFIFSILAEGNHYDYLGLLKTKK